MALWEWAAAGAVFIAVVILSVRLMKRGLTTLEDDRAQCLERIRRMEEKILEDQKNMPSTQHLRIAHAGVEDLLRLAGNPPGTRLEAVNAGQGESGGEALVLHVPEGAFRISLSMRERTLRGVHKVAHGKGIWHLRGPGVHGDYADLVLLMRALSARLAVSMEGAEGEGCAAFRPLGDPAADVSPELPHLARRFASARAVPRPRKPVVKNSTSEDAQERPGAFRNGRRTSANPGPVGGRHR